MLGTYHEHGQACLIVDPEQVLEVLAWLRDTPGQEYRFLASVHGVDYLPAEPRFGVHYELLNRDRVERIRVRAALADPGGDELPEVDSCVELFPTAEYQEREVYDFFGIVFRGHPDLRRILLPEDLRRLAAAPRLPDRRRAGDLHPQRAPGPGVVGVTDVRDRERDERHHSAPAHGGDLLSETSATVIGGSAVEVTEAGELLEPEHELLTVNMGPHHPATHGVLRLLVSLKGEEVIDLKPIVGYVHTGIEKSCEDKSYWKVIPFVERMDYLSYFFNMQAFCGAVETMLELEIPPRAAVPAHDPPRAQPACTHTCSGSGPRRSTSARSRCSGTRCASATRSSTCSRCRPVSGCTRATSRSAASSRTSRSASSRSCAPSAPRCPTRDRPVRGARQPQRDLPPAHQGRRHRLPRAAARPRRHRPAAARRRRALGPAQGRPLSRLRRRRLQDPGRHGRRRLRPLPVPHAGDARVGEDHRAVPRRPARGAVDRRRPQGRAAAARRALDLDGVADPPLQARHRGLPGAAGRDLLPDRVAPGRARLLTCSPTARRSRRGSTSATRRSSTSRRCATCRSAATSRT